jgi:hypothetical protein
MLVGSLQLFAVDGKEVIDNLKFSGDFRLRYEYLDKDDSMTRGRARIRFRLNAFTKITDKWEVGFSLATGSNEDPTSTNQSMDDNFTQKSIWLDKAYARYRHGNFTFTGGKMKNPFTKTDIIWDSDINLEGASEKWSFSKKSYITLGQFTINESGSHADSFLLAVQGGTGFRNFKISGTYYLFQNYVDYSPKTAGNIFENNTEFELVDILMEIGLSKNFSVWADYVVNTGAEITDLTGDKEDTAFGLGVKYKYEMWKFQIMYKKIEPNAVVGAFADATFGGADRKGFQAKLSKKLGKKMSAAVSVYSTESTLYDNFDATVVDFDLNFKF